MPFLPNSKTKWFALVPVLAIALFTAHTGARAGDGASVETFTNQAVPSDVPPQYDRYNSPLKAGELTLGDVLKAHEKPKPVPPKATLHAPTTAPLMNSKASSANLMLMQGMKSVMQQEGGSSSGKLQAPQMGGGGGLAGSTKALLPATTTTTTQTTAPVNVTPAPGVTFEAGQEPRNLATGAVISTAPPAAATSGVETVTTTTTTVETPAPVVSPAPVVPPAPVKSATVSKSSGGCEEHSQTWTKTCVEAGYPAAFTGKITGETRTTCPDGGLQDVWIANSCAPAGDGSAANYAPTPNVAPAAAPQTQEEVISNATSESSTAAMAAAPGPVPETMAAPSVVSHYERTDAGCGAANGLASNVRPSVDLCRSGDPSDVSGDGPWRWNCKGFSGGMTVSCAAPVATAPAAATTPAAPVAKAARTASTPAATEDGVCGAADGAGTDHAPAADLCVHGVASRVSGNGPWTWACSGLNGGQAAACTAPKKTDGICGAATRTGTDQMPTADLCSAGYASAVTGEGPWNWTCSGLYGGAASMCSAAPKRDAVCGSASTIGQHQAPQEDLCSVGQASSVHGGGPWNWTCNGVNGGSTVNCSAAIAVNGSCGSANGVAVAKAPAEGLCTRGSPTRVTGTGPWTWNCSGTDGGETESCAAPLMSRQQREEAAAPSSPAPIATPEPAPAPAAEVAAPVSTPPSMPSADNICGGASELLALAAPEADLCKTGKASSVTGTGPWTWTCTDDSGHTSDCSTLSPAGSAPAPKAKAGSSSTSLLAVPQHKPAAETLQVPAEAATPAIATAAPTPVVEQATCGAANGEGTRRAPAVELCTVGKATPVKGGGPWKWTCVKGRSKANCEAPVMADGACGVANGSIQKFAPVKGLCSSGSPTEVQGNGPWLWTCVGSGGGQSTSCSATSQAQTRVDGSCGVAANAPAQAIPDVNLCDSGVPSSVYGEGPWTWTCSGLNGGVASSCSTQKNIPAAPPPPGPPVNGLCGNSNGVAMVVQPMDDLCSAGTATAISGSGPWNWNCLGTNGGMTVSCTAPLQPPAPITGACGSASGVPTLTPPRSGLCSAGISSAVSGHGPWTWSCSGTNGGGAVGCVAPLAGMETGSLPSVTTPAEAPAPKAAPSSRVVTTGLATPKLPSGPLPPLKSSGTMPPTPLFSPPPSPSSVPPVPSPEEVEAPAQADLPAGTTALKPPALRDSLKSAPALQNDVKNSVAGNHFTLDEDISTIPFTQASENIDSDALPKLDKLAAVLVDHAAARITLTAYAGVSNGTGPREARRLSLTRALAVRDYLTAKGIASGRIDVRALGANTSSGDPDRIDVKVN